MANVTDSAGGLKTHPTGSQAADTEPLTDRVRSLRLPTHVEAGHGSARRIIIVLAVVAVLAVAVVVFLALRSRLGAGSANADKPGTATPPTGTAAAAEATSGKQYSLEAKGYIVPARQILVSPQVSGILLELNVEEGKKVKKGDILGRVEDTEYRADYNRAKGIRDMAAAVVQELEEGNRKQEIEQARADLAETEAQLEYWTGVEKRYRQLVESKVISPEQYDDAQSRKRALFFHREKLQNTLELLEIGARQTRRDSAKADLDRAEAELAKAKWRLDNCLIVAPITGTVLKKNAEKGNMVNPIAFNGSFSICDLADLADLEVDLAIQERDIDLVKPRQQCEIRTEAYPNRVYQGVVSRKMPIADRAKGTISVRVKINVPAEEAGIYLKPEMGALVSFLDEAKAATPPATPPASKP